MALNINVQSDASKARNDLLQLKQAVSALSSFLANDFTNALNSAANELTQNENAMKSASQGSKELNSSLKNTEAAFNKAEKEIDENTQALKENQSAGQLLNQTSSQIKSSQDTLQKEFQESEKALDEMNKSQNSAKKSGESFFKSMLKANFVTNALSILGNALKNIASEAFQTSLNFEKNTVAFETMLKSAGRAQTLLKQIEDFAASTPFQLETLVTGSKRLLAFGVAQNEIIQTMQNLGNAAGGNEEILDRLTLAYGKLRAKGKASLEELNMFTEAGVPIMDALAKQYDVSTEKLFKLISTGQVGFEDVNRAITSLTTGTGQFAGLIEKQSQTLSGLMSTAKDNVNLLTKDIIDLFVPAMKDMANQTIQAASAAREFINSLEFRSAFAGIIATFQTFGSLLKEEFLEAFNRVSDAFAELKNATMPLFNALGGISEQFNLGNIAAAIFTRAIETIGFFIKRVANTITLAVNIISNFVNFIGAIGKAIKEGLTSQIQNIVEFGDAIINAGKAVGLAIKGLFDEKARKDSKLLWEESKQAFNDFNNDVVGFLPKTAATMHQTLVNITNSTGQLFKDNFDDIVEFGKQSAEDIVDLFITSNEEIAKTQEEFKNNYQNNLNEISNSIQSADLAGEEQAEKAGIEWNSVFSNIADSSKAMSENIITNFDGITGDIGRIGQTIFNSMSNLFKKLSDESASTGDKIAAGITAGLETLNSGVQFAFSEVGRFFDNELANIDSRYQKELEKFDTKEVDKVELARQRLEELQTVQQESDAVFDEARLMELENYKMHLAGLTDEDINRALAQKEIEIRQAQESAKIDNSEQIRQAKIALDEAKRDKKLADEKAAVEEKFQREKLETQKKAFQAEKAGQIAQVWIQTALGIVSAWASSMQLGPIAGPIAASILTTIMLGVAAGQTAAIATRQFPGFQSGVTDFAGGTALVGEQGPELVTLGRGSNVITNENTNKILSGIGRAQSDERNNISYVTELNVFLDGELLDTRIVENRRYADARIGVV